MKFGIIRPRGKEFAVADAPSVQDACRQAGLDPSDVDHGTVARGVGIVVAGFGLYEPPEKQSYFGLAGRLYAGPAVIYRYNARGDTIPFDLQPIDFEPHILWLPTAADVERAIGERKVERPIGAVNGEVFWRWPEPRPDLHAVVEKMAGADTVVVDKDTIITREP